jgi:hypothetical protein
LAEAERERGLKPRTLPIIKNYTTVNEFRNWAAEDTPVVVIVSPGLAEEPAMKGDGTYRAKFHLGVAVIVEANNRDNTRKLARIYGPVVRQLMLQQQGLGGISSAVEYEDERYDEPPEREDHAVMAVQVTFRVEVHNVVNKRLGIAEPSADPYGLGTEFDNPVEANITIEKKDEVGA